MFGFRRIISNSNFRIVDANEPIASLGKVLADRSTLYKYLNPHVVGYVTEEPFYVPKDDPSDDPSIVSRFCGVYLVDGAKGTIIYHSKIYNIAILPIG